MVFWLVGGVAMVSTGASAQVVRRLLIRHNLLDRPNHRSSHQVPVPRGGGIACAVGVVAGALVAQLAGGPVPWLVLGAALILGLVGFVDDRYHLPAMPRLGAQILVGVLVGWAIGGLLLALIGALLAPLLVNVVNFMDGINGITAATMTIWGGAAIYYGYQAGIEPLILIGIFALCSSIGFLPWNIPSPKLFLGDTGSYFFGMLLTGAILLHSSNAWSDDRIVLAPLSIYVFDVGYTLLRRASKGSRLTEPHREHIYQRLTMALGESHVKATLIISVMIVFATLSAFTPLRIMLILIIALLVTYAMSPRLLRTRTQH